MSATFVAALIEGALDDELGHTTFGEAGEHASKERIATLTSDRSMRTLILRARRRYRPQR